MEVRGVDRLSEWRGIVEAGERGWRELICLYDGEENEGLLV